MLCRCSSILACRRYLRQHKHMVLSVAQLAVLYMVCLYVNVYWRGSLPVINLCAFVVIPYAHHQCAQSGFLPGGPG